MSPDPLDTPERQAARREATLPSHLFTISTVRDYCDLVETALKNRDWADALLAGGRIHEEVCGMNHELAEDLPLSEKRRLQRESMAEQLGIDPSSIMHVESGDELAEQIQRGILDPASKGRLTDQMREMGLTSASAEEPHDVPPTPDEP